MPLFFRGDFLRYGEKGTRIPPEFLCGAKTWPFTSIFQYLHNNKDGTARVLLRGTCLPDRVVDSPQYPAVYADIPIDDLVLYRRRNDNDVYRRLKPEFR